MRASRHSSPSPRSSFRSGDVCGAIPLLVAHHAHRRRRPQRRREGVSQNAGHSLPQGPFASPSARRPTDSFPSQPHVPLDRLHVAVMRHGALQRRKIRRTPPSPPCPGPTWPSRPRCARRATLPRHPVPPSGEATFAAPYHSSPPITHTAAAKRSADGAAAAVQAKRVLRGTHFAYHSHLHGVSLVLHSKCICT